MTRESGLVTVTYWAFSESWRLGCEPVRLMILLMNSSEEIDAEYVSIEDRRRCKAPLPQKRMLYIESPRCAVVALGIRGGIVDYNSLSRQVSFCWLPLTNS